MPYVISHWIADGPIAPSGNILRALDKGIIIQNRFNESLSVLTAHGFKYAFAGDTIVEYDDGTFGVRNIIDYDDEIEEKEEKGGNVMEIKLTISADERLLKAIEAFTSVMINAIDINNKEQKEIKNTIEEMDKLLYPTQEAPAEVTAKKETKKEEVKEEVDYAALRINVKSLAAKLMATHRDEVKAIISAAGGKISDVPDKKLQEVYDQLGGIK